MRSLEFTNLAEPAEPSSLTSVPIVPQPVTTSAKRLRILLAEDTEINRQLAIHLLESQGHYVSVAENGRKALEALEDSQFDVVLMDVQMPDIDGLQATLTIRSRERATGAHLPIIAMTAQAMKGDRERCIAGGMDGYLSKPIRPKELFQAIDQVLLGSTAPARAAGEDTYASEGSGTPRQLHLAELLASVNGNAVVLSKLVTLFRKHYPKMLAELREAVNQEDGERLARAAHTLRGGSGSFLNGAARDALESLEAMGMIGSTGKSEATLALLETEMICIDKVLTGFVTKTGA